MKYQQQQLDVGQPNPGNEVVVRGSGAVTPFNAGDAVAAACDMYPGPIPSSWKARLGKSAKQLLEDGFDPPSICAALYMAIRRARPDMAESFVVEIAQAKTGVIWSWSEYRQFLVTLARDANPELDTIHRALEEYFA